MRTVGEEVARMRVRPCHISDRYYQAMVVKEPTVELSEKEEARKDKVFPCGIFWGAPRWLALSQVQYQTICALPALAP